MRLKRFAKLFVSEFLSKQTERKKNSLRNYLIKLLKKNSRQF